jgi:uncharacterized protein (DUF1330 family)
MSCYFIANIKIHDDQEYRKYLEGADAIFKRYHGEYLSVDNHPVILEGHWDYTRTVLIRFDSRDDFMEWYNSTDYQNILKFRLEAAVCDTILAEGLS